MNLINDVWLPVIRQDGSKTKIAPWQIAESDNPVVEIDAPRPDFQGALYQLVIGLLQTTFAPEDQEQWFEFWEEKPEPEELQQAFDSVSTAFELFSDEPVFLQDFDLPEGEQRPLSGLLIDAPGENTLKKNFDHFIKGGVYGVACESCTASALFTLQSFAPSGGSGHRVGLRGGGPLTTLVMPGLADTSLWKKLWLNVLTQEEYSTEFKQQADIFPWLAPTRLSDKTGKSTLPENTHPLQMYWGMPRRIRLQPEDKNGTCSLCGEQSERLTSHFITKNYGVNYEGPWTHPLTPYRKDPKNIKPPLSLKGQQGGLGYRHWLGLNLQDANSGDGAAEVVQHWQERASTFSEIADDAMRLWCFGFDMDNMKARCWYDHQMPLIAIDEAYREVFTELVIQLMSAAKEALYLLRSQIKSAWFERPSDAKGDISMIDHGFWQATESTFYTLLNSLAALPSNTNTLPPETAQQWLTLLRRTTVEQFDYWVLEGDVEDRDMRRIFKSRKTLLGKLKNTPSLKQLAQIASVLKANETESEVA